MNPELEVGLRASVRALLIGINYTNTPYPLRGCINDVERVKDLLVRLYGVTNVVVLSDLHPESSSFYPSHKNIMRHLRALFTGLGADDRGFLHYSGHGRVDPGVRSNSGGSMIVPADALAKGRPGTKGVIDDDKLINNDVLWEECNKIHVDARLFALVDACHSGQILELPYTITLHSSESAQECSLIRSKDHIARGGSIILLSACSSDQTALDLTFDGKRAGALTFAFCETIKKNPHITYMALLKAMRAFMAHNAKDEGSYQIPQLSFSHMDDCSRPFRIGASPRKARRGLEEELVFALN